MLSALIIALILDTLIGDPHVSWHPVRLIGKLCSLAETISRDSKSSPFFSGAFATLLILSTVLAVTFTLSRVAQSIHPYLGTVVDGILIYFSIALKDLKKQAKRIVSALAQKNIPRARKRLSMIVGRDCKYLEEEEICRATVETVAENSVDGVLSPLFYALLLGPIGAVCYRTINTMDSMFGHKNERYIEFGRIPARLDDSANYIPARLSVIFLSLAAGCVGKKPQKAFAMALRDGKNHASPNSGFSEASVAGALSIRLGGTHTYDGLSIKKPFIGDDIKTCTSDDIKTSCHILSIATLLFMLSAAGLLQAFN